MKDSSNITNVIPKVDMVITHISDCILELDGDRTREIPPMAMALAKLVEAKASAELYHFE